MSVTTSRVEPFLGCGIGGILKGVFGIEGAMAVIHGPMSCASGHRIVPLFANKEPLLPSTAITEIDAVMGTEDRLRQSLLKAIEIYKPKLLVAILTCATSLTGEVYDAVVKSIEKEAGIPVLLLDGSGITGDELTAYLDFYRAFRTIQPKKVPGGQDTIEIAGLSAADYGNVQNLACLQYLLLDFLKIKVSRVLFSGLSLDPEVWFESPTLEIGRLWLESATPNAAPFGAMGTLRWLEINSKLLGRSLSDEVGQHYSFAHDLIKSAREAGIGKGLRVGIEAESWWAIGLAHFLKDELDCEVLLSSDSGTVRYQEKYSSVCDTLVDIGNVELCMHFREFGAQLVFGSSYSKNGLWGWVPLWQPIYHVVPDYQSLMGFNGVPFLIEALQQARKV